MPIRLHVLVSAARHAVSSSVLVYRLIAFHLTPLLLHLTYFLAVDLLGFLALVLLRPSSSSAGSSYRLRHVDLFFMSTSAVTVTGLATVEMEDLSTAQLVVLTLLMLLGSEMFVSLLGLIFQSSSRKRRQQQLHDHQDHDSRVMAAAIRDEPDLEEANGPAPTDLSSADSSGDGGDRKDSRCTGVGSLALVVSTYMAAILIAGSVLVFAYVATVPTARDVLARKGINAALFSVSTTVSSFTNGGLLPTNESMAVFAANRGLLLLLAAQILAGSTLLPVFLRLAVSVMTRIAGAFTGRGVAEELESSMEKSAEAAGLGHLLPAGPQAAFLAATVVGVAAAAAALFCFLNWNSAVFAGLTAGEKLTNAVFMAVNVRQAGENSVDCSLVAPAVLVLFLAMMCIPASAALVSVHDGGGDRKRSAAAGELEQRKDGGAEKKRRRLSLNSMLLSPLACNAVAVMLACITERRSISGDPLNFSTFNVIFEVISAYGNVGLSTGYSCSRLLPAAAEATAACHDKPYSFSGWWSDQGKLLLVLLMLYGRLKGFHGQRRRR